MSKPPMPTFTLTLTIGACEWDRLVKRLEAEARHIAEHGPTCKSCWGGAGTHGHVLIEHRPEITLEAYEKELHDWWMSNKTDDTEAYPNRSSTPESETAPVAAGAVSSTSTTTYETHP